MLHQNRTHRNETEAKDPKGEEAPAEKPRVRQRRGFAAMDPNKQREIASRGGRASHERGTGHEWSATEAREAGRKGGKISQQRRAAARTGAPDEGEPTN